jgi:hypothetical protein
VYIYKSPTNEILFFFWPKLKTQFAAAVTLCGALHRIILLKDKTGQIRDSVTLGRFHVTTVAVENQ